MHSAGGRAADADGERAETYLRLVAEAALRSAADGRADRVRNAADVLVDAGVLADTVAAQIIADLNVALRLRGRRSAQTLAGRLLRTAPLQPGQRIPLLPDKAPEPSAGLAPPWRVLPAGPGTPASRLMALILTADRAVAPATLFFPLSDGPPEAGTPPFTQLTGTDDTGMEYRLGFTNGTWAGSAWTGTVIFLPSPPAAVRWLAIMSQNGPLLRVEITAAPPAAATPIVMLGPVPETLGERLLIRRAEAMLAANALGYPLEGGQPRQGEAVAALEGAGVLAPLSPVPARLSALGQLLGLAMQGPADEVPGRWKAVMTHYGRRKRLNPVSGTATIAVDLPEIDGTRFVIAGLRSGSAGTFLHVLVDRLPRPVTRSRPDIGFSWWFRDDADCWHLGAVEDVGAVGGSEAMLRLVLLPPLRHEASALTAEIRGATQQLTANLQVRW
ncbi:MAG TPA: hypothetical protein VNV62_09040 [Trebonia sp.]|nr:hypothetical protein [Trebonia sp.]